MRLREAFTESRSGFTSGLDGTVADLEAVAREEGMKYGFTSC